MWIALKRDWNSKTLRVVQGDRALLSFGESSNFGRCFPTLHGKLWPRQE